MPRLKQSTKQCIGCKQYKPLDQFYATGKGYHHGRCKPCHISFVRKYVDKAKAKVYQKRYYDSHKQYYVEWRANHPDASKLYYARHREAILAKRKARRAVKRQAHDRP